MGKVWIAGEMFRKIKNISGPSDTNNKEKK